MPKLLLAEDNDFSRELLTRRLENAGHQIIAVANGREAILAARQYRPDLILMDLEMPVMDGRAAIRTLKIDPHTYRIPIIVVSAHMAEEIIAATYSDGCEAYEAKPVIVSRLLERINETLHALSTTPRQPKLSLAPDAPATPPEIS
ncbi:MAG TPA: response regulator [Bryobacteraceae bacterium]|nr:response regulator [Bryobacteraceae bacterium]